MNRTEKIKAMVNSHCDFYTKRYQSNMYYPIDKYEWHEDDGTYWRVPFKDKNAYSYANEHGITYILLHNTCIISVNELFDSKNYYSEEENFIF